MILPRLRLGPEPGISAYMIVLFRLGALLSAIGVGMGAFGAHALKETLTANGHMETWRTAVLYHLLHSIALCALASSKALPKGAGWCFLAGIVLFSGSLYGISLKMPPAILGPITPLGGLCFIVGWLWTSGSFAKQRFPELNQTQG